MSYKKTKQEQREDMLLTFKHKRENKLTKIQNILIQNQQLTEEIEQVKNHNFLLMMQVKKLEKELNSLKNSSISFNSNKLDDHIKIICSLPCF